MTSTQTNRLSMGDACRHRMTSLSVPVDTARAQSTLPALCTLPPEVYCCAEDGQRQIILLVAVPQQNCTDEPTTTPMDRSADVSASQIAEDLTTRPTRCCNSELHTNEGLLRGRTLRDDERADNTQDQSAVATPRLSASNPVFGKSKSPKSYWLRRHSDSVFAAADRDLAQRDDESEPSGKDASRHGKVRTVSDSHTVVREFEASASALLDDRKPLTHRFQSTVVGMQFSGESDEVFDESPAFQSTHSRKDVSAAQQHSEEPMATELQLEESSVHRRRVRLTVNLEDIDEEHQNHSAGLDEYEDDSRGGESVADSSTFAKMEVNEVTDEPPNDGVRSMEFSVSDNPLWQYSEEATHRDAENRKLNVERERARPEAASSSRRVSRVARSSRPSAPGEPTSRCDATSGGGGKIHRCAVCRRTFSRSDMLERHARLHTGVRPYACRLCTQVFSRSDHLTTHLRTHTGEKPYACPRCAYTASRRDMVTRHLRVHQSTPAVDPAQPVSGVVGPSRRRIYRSRYKERSARPGVQRPDVDDIGIVASRTTSSPEPQSALLDEGTSYVRSAIDEHRLSGVALTWPGARRLDTPAISLSSPSPPSSETATRRCLEHFQALHALSRPVVARGSTGSTDSYSSPGSLSAGDVFEFAVSGNGVEGSPDVFRSPSATRQSTMFLFPYTAASTALSVCDQTDSF